MRSHEVTQEWKNGPRVRMDSLKKGQRYRDMVGRTFTYEAVDDKYSGAHHSLDEDGKDTVFAGCAEVVLLPSLENCDTTETA